MARVFLSQIAADVLRGTNYYYTLFLSEDGSRKYERDLNLMLADER